MGREIKLAELTKSEIRERIEKSWNETTPTYKIVKEAFGKRVYSARGRKQKIHKGIALSVSISARESGSGYLILTLCYCNIMIDILMCEGKVREIRKLMWDEIERAWLDADWSSN